MGSGCGVKSAKSTKISQPGRIAPPQATEESNILDTEVDGISMRRANMGHYFVERGLYPPPDDQSRLREVWYKMCTLCLAPVRPGEQLFVPRKTVIIDRDLTDERAETGMLAFLQRVEPPVNSCLHLSNHNGSMAQFYKLLGEGPHARYRWTAWKVALRVKDIRVPGLYEDLKSQKNAWLGDIRKDLDRTFPTHPLFADGQFGEHGKRALENILLAYAIFNKGVGYCQGMNFLTAFMLILSGYHEEDVFWATVSLTKHRLSKDPLSINGIEGLFSERFPLLRSLQKLFEHILKETVPPLKEHLDAIEFPNELWLQKWISTIFLYSLPKTYCVRLWDYVICHGFSHVLTLCLAILRHLKPKLLSTDFSGCYELLKGLKDNDSLPDPDELIASASKIKLDWKKFDSQFYQLQQEVEREDREVLQKKLEREQAERAAELLAGKKPLAAKEDCNPQDTSQLRMEEFPMPEPSTKGLPMIRRIRRKKRLPAKVEKPRAASISKAERDEVKLPPITQGNKKMFIFESNSNLFEDDVSPMDGNDENGGSPGGNSNKNATPNKGMSASFEAIQTHRSAQKSSRHDIDFGPDMRNCEGRRSVAMSEKGVPRKGNEEEIRTARLEDEDSLVFASQGGKTVRIIAAYKSRAVCDSKLIVI